MPAKRFCCGFVLSLFLAFSFCQVAASYKKYLASAALGFLGAMGLKLFFNRYLPKQNVPHIYVEQFSYVMFPTESFDNFVGYPSVEDEARQFIRAARVFLRYRDLGAQKTKGLFVGGARGSGKSLLVHAIAKELGGCIVPLNGYWLLNSVDEKSHELIKQVFDFGHSKAKKWPTIILIDNLDVLNSTELFYNFNQKIIEEIAAQIENIGDHEELYAVVTATSSADINNRLFKPGCIDRVIHIPLPDSQAREEILLDCLRQRFEVDSEDLSFVIEKTGGFSAAMLKNVISDALLTAEGEGALEIETDHWLRACTNVYERSMSGRKTARGVEAFDYTFSEQTTFDDVVGLDDVLVEVREVVEFLHNRDKFAELGARLPRGLLLYGPSGCGKTLIARAIAGEAMCGFIFVSGTEFVKEFVGTGPLAVRRLFSFARDMSKNIPVIIFIDEIDGIGCRSLVGHTSSGREYDNTVNELLKQMDGFRQDENIFVIGATNLPQKLDPAILRAGRFDRKIEIPLPNVAARRKMIAYFVEKINLYGSVDAVAERFALASMGFSGADLEVFVNEAAILAGREQADAVLEKHFELALGKVRSSFQKSEFACT